MRKLITATALSCLFSMGCATLSPSSQVASSSNESSETVSFSQIHVTAPDTVQLGTRFEVEFRIADREGNTVRRDDLLEVGANKSGINFSSSKVSIKDGSGRIWAESSSWSGEGLMITARSIVDVGEAFIHGSKRMVISPAEQ